ncbi:MAG: hypothetical protein AAF224_07995 [Pseudomonadota bacterium]
MTDLRKLCCAFAAAMLLSACGSDNDASPPNTGTPSTGTPNAAASETDVNSASKAPGPSSTLKETECVTPALKAVNAKCWSLNVAENRDAPDGNRIVLPVGVIHTTDDPAQRPEDPILFFVGGTADSALANEDYIRHYLDMAAPRSLIIWDMRGLFHAQPNLQCPDFDLPQNILNAYAGYPSFSDEPIAARVEATGQDYADCLAKLRSEGVNVEFYNGFEMARDAADLMRLLGYDTYNVMGQSAGTGHVFNFIQYFDDHIRAAIYDAPWITQARDRPAVNILHQAYDDALDLLEHCRRDDPNCADILPNPSATLIEARARLDREPFTTNVTLPSGEERALEFDGSKLVGRLYGGMDGGYGDFPRVLKTVAEGDYRLLPDFFDIENAVIPPENDPIWTLGAMAAYECGDMNRVKPSKAAVINMFEREPALLYGFDTGAFCSWWDAETSAPLEHHSWFQHDTPSLVLVGEADPCCGRQYGERLHRHNDLVYIAEFAGRGHNSRGRALSSDGRPCQREIVSEFLSDPNQKPDMSCLAGYKREWNLAP